MSHRYPSKYLMDLPKHVLFDSAKLLAWCENNKKQRPTLLDLGTARAARRGKGKR